MFSARHTAILCSLAALLLGATQARAQGAFQLTATASGNTVLLNWTPVPGALLYGLEAQLQGGPSVPLTPVGTQTSFQIPNVPAGTYHVRVTASNFVQHVQSNIATVVVSAPGATTPAPVNFAAIASGNSVLFSWNLPTTDGLLGLLVEQLSGPGGVVVDQVPVRVSTSAHVPHVPNGVYTARIRAVGAGGLSAPSNEISLAVPSCTTPGGFALTVQTSGTSLNVAWPAVPGATSYTLQVSNVPGGSPNVIVQQFPASQTGFSTYGVAPGTYYAKVVANTACGAATSNEEAIAIVNTPNQRRPAGAVPLGTLTSEVLAAGHAVTAQYPGSLQSSCVEHGGNNLWLFRVVQRLRAIDSRYGLIWKYADVGNMSQDVITYNFADVPDESASAPHLHSWDVIGGHCGSNPSPWAQYIGNPNGQALWTIQPYLQAGFQ